MTAAQIQNSSPRAIALTFILPTRNRGEWVGRAIESCLAVGQEEIAVEVLVVDGNSTDGSFEALQARYGGEPRVRLVRQEGPKGFMPACFFAVPLVRTPYATFMYDDDVLSPFWVELPRELRRREAEFVMGFGGEEQIAKVYPFQRPERLLLPSPSFLLRAYLGCGRQLSTRGLPCNPISCLTRTERLREWVSQVQRFAGSRPLRDYFMLQRNAGPDLMIYFLALARHQGEVPVFDEFVAQFSVNESSFTSGLETTDLRLGYWLAGIWLCEQLRAQGQYADAGWCAAYTIRSGLQLVLKRLARRRARWTSALLSEVVTLAARTLASAAALALLRSFLILLLPRRWRPQLGLSARVEPLQAAVPN